MSLRLPYEKPPWREGKSRMRPGKTAEDKRIGAWLPPEQRKLRARIKSTEDVKRRGKSNRWMDLV